MADPLNKEVINRLRLISITGGLLVIVLGVIGIIEWGYEQLFNGPNFLFYIPIRSDSAIAYLISGLLILGVNKENITKSNRVVFYLTLAVLTVWSLSFFVIGLLPNENISIQLHGEAFYLQKGGIHFDRMKLTTALFFVFISIIFWIYDRPKMSRWLQLICFIIWTNAFLNLSSFAYDLRKADYGLGLYTQMSLFTSVILFIIPVSVLFSRPQKGVVRYLVKDGLSGLVLRRMIPLAVLISGSQGWLQAWGEKARFFDSSFGEGVMSLFFVVGLFLVIVCTSKKLGRMDNQLRKYQKELELKVLHRTAALTEANRELKAARNELEILDQAKTEFLQLISHEIRTPLYGIVGSLGLVDDQKLSEENRVLLNILKLSSKRLENFSYEALEIMKLRTLQTEPLEFQLINLSEILELCLEEKRSEINRRNLLLSVNIQDKDQKILGVPHYLHKSILNLLENAVTHSPIESKIQIDLQSVEDTTVLRFVDEGSGFPQKILNSPLKPFLFLKREDGRIGLGLYYTHLVMKLHKGSFRYVNNDRIGALVEMIFPA